MLKAFFRDSAVYGTAKLLTGSIALLTLPIYTHALSPAEYGVVDLLTTIAAIAYVTVALEIAQGFGRYVLSPEAAGLRERYASTALWFTIAANALFAAVVMPFARPISLLLFGTADKSVIVRVATLVIASTGVFYLVQAVLRYERRAVRYAIVSVVYSIASVGVTVVLLLVVHTGLVGVFVGQSAAAVVAVGLGLWFARDSIGVMFDRARCREMLVFSLPLVPSGLGVMLCMYTDRFAVVRLMSFENLGFYGLAFRLASVVGVALAGFQAAVAPLIYQHYQDPASPRQVARMFHWFLAVALPLVLFLGLFAAELVRLMAPAVYLPATRLVFLLSASILLSGCYAFSPGLWIAKRTGWVAVIAIASAAMNLVLNFVFIPWIGLVGAAIATLISAAAGCSAHMIFGRTYYPVAFHWRRIGVVSALVSAVGLLAGRTLQLAGLSGPTELVVRGLTWAVVSVAVVVILVGAEDVRLVTAQIGAATRRLRAGGEPVGATFRG